MVFLSARRILTWLWASVICLTGAVIPAGAQENPPLPEGFCYVGEVIPDLVVDLRYAGEDNFVGRPIEGYTLGQAVLTHQAAQALAGVQQDLAEQGLQLILWDAYRPQRASDDFVAWSKDEMDQTQKEAYYPDVAKADLFTLGYIARRSSHSRGSTVDVGLLDDQGQALDMGSAFDVFGEISAYDAQGLSDPQKANRALLRQVMLDHGFLPYEAEWWHFRLDREPYPDTYFDFPI